MSAKYNRVRPAEPDYTHAVHAQACQDAAQARETLVQRVLVRKQGVVYCAVIKNAYRVPGGPDCWTVEAIWPEVTRLTVVCKNVIACDPAGCSCLGSLSSDSEPAPGVTCL